MYYKRVERYIVDIDEIKKCEVGDKFILVPKTKHTFATPIDFKIDMIKVSESNDPYHPFDKITFINSDGLEYTIDTGMSFADTTEYTVYKNYQDWYNKEVKKVEEKKQTYLLAKKYTEDFEKYFKRFSDENPEKLI